MSPTHGGPLWCKLTLKVRHARCQVTCINCDGTAANILRSLKMYLPVTHVVRSGKFLFGREQQSHDALTVGWRLFITTKFDNWRPAEFSQILQIFHQTTEFS